MWTNYNIFTVKPLSYASNNNKHLNITQNVLHTCTSQCESFTLFQITNLMHNSFILQQYVCHTTILNMFRAARRSS